MGIVTLPTTPGSGGPDAAFDEITVAAVLGAAQLTKVALGDPGAFQKFLTAGVQTIANSISVCLASDEARANILAVLTGHKAVEVAPADDYVYVDGVMYPIQRVIIDEATAGSQQIVAAVSGKKIRVVKYSLTVASATVLQWLSASTPISGPMDFSAGIVEPLCKSGIFLDGGTNEALNLDLADSVQVSGNLSYIAYTP